MKNKCTYTHRSNEKLETLSIEMMLYIEQEDRKVRSMERQDRRKHAYLHDGIAADRQVEDIVMESFVHKQIQKALSALTKKQRRRVYLHFYRNMNYTEIAKLENISVMAVSLSIRNALKRMKKNLENSFIRN